MPNDFLDLASDSLNILDKSIHNKIQGSYVDTFIHELQDYLTKIQSASLLDYMPKHTILTFAKYDGNFAVCFDYDDKKIYYMPRNDIVGTKPEPGEALKWHFPGKFYVDTTAILAEEDKLDGYLQECTIAK